MPRTATTTCRRLSGLVAQYSGLAGCSSAMPVAASDSDGGQVRRARCTSASVPALCMVLEYHSSIQAGSETPIPRAAPLPAGTTCGMASESARRGARLPRSNDIHDPAGSSAGRIHCARAPSRHRQLGLFDKPRAARSEDHGTERAGQQRRARIWHLTGAPRGRLRLSVRERPSVSVCLLKVAFSRPAAVCTAALRRRSLSAAFGRTAVLPNPASLAGDDASAARYNPQRTRASNEALK